MQPLNDIRVLAVTVFLAGPFLSMTLARFGAGLRSEAAQEMRDFAARRMGVRAGPFPVEEFILYRSTLGRSAPIYEELAVYPLISAGES